MFKKTLKAVFFGYLTYFTYCFTRGLIWGIRNPNYTQAELSDFANKAARFRA